MKGFPDLPPLWLALFCILAWFLGTELPIYSVASPGLRATGAVLSVLGLCLIAWAAIWFHRSGTTIEPHHTPSVLILDGPFRFSRNPIYLGMAMILTGLVLWYGALSAVILPGIFISVISLRFAIPEENRLIETFGDDARAYLERTRRWL